jgi:hypothetical protein
MHARVPCVPGSLSARQTSALLPACPPLQVHPSRHQFLLRMLAALVQGPCKDWQPLVRPLLLVASQTLSPSPAPWPSAQAAPAVQPEAEAEAAAGQPWVALGWSWGWDWGAGRTLAKQLLSGQRESLVLWGAYAELEGRAGNLKVASPRGGAAREVGAPATGPSNCSPAGGFLSPKEVAFLISPKHVVSGV